MSNSTFRFGKHELTFKDLPSGAGVRWAVGSPDGRRSSTWRLWGNKKGDVYLSMRSQGSRLKASFHKDKRCSIGFTKEYEATAMERFGDKSRHWERWQLPETNVVRVAQIIFPDSELAMLEPDKPTHMKWIPAPGPENAVVVSIFIAEPPDSFNWPGPEKGGQLIGIMHAATRFTWAVHKKQHLNAETVKLIEGGRVNACNMPSDVEVPWAHPGLRYTLWGYGETLADMFLIELNASKQAEKETVANQSPENDA